MNLGNIPFFTVSLALSKSRFLKCALLTACFDGLHPCQAGRGQTDNRETQLRASAEEWFRRWRLTHYWTGSIRKLGKAKGRQRCEDMGTLSHAGEQSGVSGKFSLNSVYDSPVPLCVHKQSPYMFAMGQ